MTKKKIKTSTILSSIALLVVLAWVFLPLFWMFISSFKSDVAIFDYPPEVIFKPTLSAYMVAFSYQWLGFFKNSLIVATGGMVFGMVLGIPAAYALSRFNVPRKNFTLMNILSVRMIPAIVPILPFFLMFNYLHLIDNYIGVILAYTTFNIPYVIWIMKGFFDQTSRDSEEAASLDGAGTLRILISIVLPQVVTGLVVVAVFSFVQGYNDFLFAFILTKESTKTIPVAVAGLLGDRFLFWNQIFAVGVMNMFPALVLAYLVRNYWVRGLTLGTVKG
jgi:multiple sugar transport system permease protein